MKQTDIENILIRRGVGRGAGSAGVRFGTKRGQNQWFAGPRTDVATWQSAGLPVIGYQPKDPVDAGGSLQRSLGLGPGCLTLSAPAVAAGA